MLSCYLDESTSIGESDPSTCVVGYVATGKQWATFGRAWNRMLEYHKVEILHTCELETEEGRKGTVFENWDIDHVKEFQNDVISIITGAGLLDVGAAVPHSVYDAVMTPSRLKNFGKTPDSFCAYLAMLSAGGYALAHRGVYKQAPSFVYERSDRCKAMLEWAHHQLVNSRVHGEFFRLSTLTPAPKSREFPQLQAADYLAFNMSKRSSHVIATVPPPIGPFEVLADGRTIRRTRYPLMALYAERDVNVWHFPTPADLEKAFQMIEADDPQSV